MNNTTEQIWQTYHTNLHRFIQSRVNNASIADDILQEVFIKIHSRIDTLKDHSKIKSWVYQITQHAIIDHYRTHEDLEPLPEILVAPENDASEQARQDIENCILPLIQRIPENYRQALMLSEIPGVTQKQVAEKQGISLSGAKSRIQRGRAMIKDMLLKCCRFEFDHQGTLIEYEVKEPRCNNC